MFAVIMAGGSGTRFWPRSRKNLPKQFLPIASERTMIEETVSRLLPLVPYDKIFFVIGEAHRHLLRERIPEAPEENILVEPAGKSTAPCLGFAAAHLHRIDPDEVMVALPADHHIGDDDLFRLALSAAVERAKVGDNLITFGIKPSYPETGYGYIEVGEKEEEIKGCEIFKVNRFVEKPDREKAESYLAAGNFFWNSGIFVFGIKTLLSAFSEHQPELYPLLEEIASARTEEEEKEAVVRFYAKAPVDSIDYAIMERAENILCVKGIFPWNDLGSFKALKAVWEKDDNGNRVRGEFFAIDSTENIIDSPKKPVAAIGVSHLVVVETDDVLLICHEDRAQEVKKIIAKLKEEGRDELL